VVWTVDISSGTLEGFSVTTGNEAFSFPLGNVVHFCPLAGGDGRIFVASNDEITALMLG
jgi:hypothetical protein